MRTSGEQEYTRRDFDSFKANRTVYSLSNGNDNYDSSILNENSSVVYKENEGVKMFVYFFEFTYLITHPSIEKIANLGWPEKTS